MTTTSIQGLTATSPDLPPGLYGYAAMHIGMRRDAARLTTTLAGSPADVGALRRWWTAFRDVIVRHHEREDDLVWPVLAAVDPSFTVHAAEMEADHEALDAVMASLDTAMTDLDGSAESIASAARAAAEFADVLVAHLEREEAVAFGRLAVRPRLWAELETKIERAMRTREAAFEIPWLHDELVSTYAGHLWARIPRPVRPIVRAIWAPRYRKLVTAAHGG